MNDWLQQVELYLELERNEQFRDIVHELKRDGKMDELKRLFHQPRLTFGTAGIRGAMGPGFSQMNDLVIIQTSQGLVSYLLETYGASLCHKRGVIIGHDARHNSARFARLTALAFLQKSIPVYFSEQIVPTPLIAFGVTYFNCHCGVMVTASHNPKQDNGYKVYWANGAQILTPHDRHIQEHIMRDENQKPWHHEWSYACDSLIQQRELPISSGPPRRLPDEMSGLLHLVYDDLCRSYFAYIQRLVSEQHHHHQDDEEETKLISSGGGSTSSHSLNITYTSMHGVGHEFLTRALAIANFKHIHPVEAQMKPDPEFPTVRFPNPEEAGALDLAFQTAAEHDSSLILANDPDADRCAAALYFPTTKRRRVLTGNELGQLLGWWAWHLNQARAAAGLRRSAAAAAAIVAQSSSGSLDEARRSESGAHAPPPPPQLTTSVYDQDLDLESTTDKTPATPITKPIIGTGCVQEVVVAARQPRPRSPARGRQPVPATAKSDAAASTVARRRSASSASAASAASSAGSSSSAAGSLAVLRKPEDCYMLSTAVSSRFLQTMARYEGFQFIETLTGFKYMGNVAHELLKRGKSVLFAYEEAIGYMVDSQILDKDGISAATQLALCASYLASAHNRSLEQQLDWLYAKYGYHYSLNSYFQCREPRTIRAIFHELQSNYPKSFKAVAQHADDHDDQEEFVVTRIRDLNNGIDNGTSDHKPDLPTSSSSFMVTFWVGDEIRFTIRTSGTEPKIKYYSEIVASLQEPALQNFEAALEEKRAIQRKLERFVGAAIERCLRPRFYKLEQAAA